ncbi:MAG: Lrp/AsnC family transcriptional regulator [Kiritimatiellae bacterium]|nr:Lrp/AsnC family transcriptional regulator [Kiritimatiellia bacterium]
MVLKHRDRELLRFEWVEPEGFRFTRHKYHNLSAKRVHSIEDFLQKRISQILEYGSQADELLKITQNNDSVNHVGDASLEVQIKSNLEADPFITYIELAEVLQISESSIARKMKNLQAAGAIRRVGAAKNGHWEVCNKPKKGR